MPLLRSMAPYQQRGMIEVPWIPAIAKRSARPVWPVVEDYMKQRGVYLQSAVVLDEAHLSELIHVEIDVRTRGPIISASVS
jgi:hypothetical protein